MKQDAKYIRWFEDIRNADVPLVGGKNASLGEMYSELAATGVKIPDGFATTAEAYWHMLDAAGTLPELKAAMKDLDKSDVADLERRGQRARGLILGAGPLPGRRGPAGRIVSASFRSLDRRWVMVRWIMDTPGARKSTTPFPDREGRCCRW